MRYNCPFCLDRRGKADDDYKLYVSVTKLTYFCFKCEAKGRLQSDPDILSMLAEPDSVVVSELQDLILELQQDEIDDEPDDDEDDDNIFMIPPNRLRPGTAAYEYMRSRGVRHEDIEFYDMREGDLTNSRFFGRVIIPNKVFNNVFTDMYVARGYLGQSKRYLNPPSSRKSEIVFNLHRIPEGADNIIIAEGAISAIFCGRTGVATYGKHVSRQQMEMIIKKRPKRIYVALDPDAHDNAIRLCDQLVGRTSIPIYLVELPEGKDPADLGYEGFQEYLKSAKRYQSKLVFDLMNLIGGW